MVMLWCKEVIRQGRQVNEDIPNVGTAWSLATKHSAHISRPLGDVSVCAQIEDAMKPNPEYFTDPNQNVIKDFFKFATQSGTSAGSVSGKDHMSRPPA